MNAFGKGLVDRRLAHKNREENVFVRDLRRAVPGTLPQALVDRTILPALSGEDQAFFSEYYRPWRLPDGSQAYTLFNIPHQLPADLFDGAGTPAEFSAAERRTLLRFYHQGPQGGDFRLRGPVTEMEDAVLSHILDPKGLALTEEERYRLANLLEAIPGLPREDVFHAGIHVDPTHPFFFEHANEHVPGMMVLEAGRQFGMACWHRFGHTPTHGVQFILHSFHTRFFDFIELSYPAFFKGEVLQADRGTKGEWNSVLFKATAFQRGEVCAEMEIQGQVISKRTFHRLRAGRQKTNPLHRFHPIESIHHKITLWNPVLQKYHKVKLWDLSMEGFRVILQDPFEDSAAGAAWETVLYFEEVGFIRSRCALVWRRKEREIDWAGFQFVGMSQEDRALLQATIRQFCQIRREREQF